MRSNRGSAILLVVFVLAVILAVAVPLALFTQTEYRRARMAEARHKARLAAEGAIDHALAYAMLTAEGAERIAGNPAPYNTPTYDSYSEFAADYSLRLYPDLANAYLSTISFANPSGLIWQSEIEDEQGKINLNSAPAPLLGNLLGSAILTERLASSDTVMHVDTTLFFGCDDDPATVDGRLRVGWEEVSYKALTETTVEGLGRNENAIDETSHRPGALVYDARAYDAAMFVCSGKDYRPFASTVELSRVIGYHDWRRVADCVTVYSSTEGASGWQRSEPVIHNGLAKDAKGLIVADIGGFGVGAIVRVLVNEEPVLVGRVAWVRSGQRNKTVWLDREIGVEAGPNDIVTLQARLPHPVNINTASIRTLSAVFKGVGLMGAGEVVDSVEAQGLAELAAQRVFTGPDDFKTFLNEAVKAGLISGRDRDALFINATEPNSAELRLATVPFTYRSYGDVTLTGRVIANDAQGRVLARRHERMVVSIPAEEDGIWGLSSQEELEKQRAASNSPHVVTWPAPVETGASPDARGLDPETGEDPLGDVRLRAAEDERPFASATLTDHFDKAGNYKLVPDGADLTGGGHVQYDSGKAFVAGRPDVEPGYFGIWAQCPSWLGRTRTFFSLGSNPNTDRIAFYYDGRAQELVTEIAGPDLEPGAARFRMRFDPEDGDWYHLGVRFAGDKPGQVTMYVDGRLPASDTVSYWIGDKPAARLDGNITDTDDKLQVDNAACFGSAECGVVQIGQEVIEYGRRASNALLDLRRGARYSVAAAHSGREMVIPFGYSNPFSSDLPRGGETLVGDVAASPSTSLTADISAGDTSIPVGSTAGFQESGFVRIGREYIYYAAKTDDTFLGCSRGQWVGAAAGHKMGSGVAGKSLLISGRSDYKTGRHVSIIGTDNVMVEWVYVGQISEKNGNVYLAPSVQMRPDGTIVESDFRSALSSPALAHKNGAKVIPVAELTGPQCGRWEPPFHERVTLIENTHRENVRLNRAHTRYGPNYDNFGNIVGWWHAYYASPDNFVSKAMSRDARFVKFPSGELPIVMPPTLLVGAEGQGANEIRGVIDELRMASKLSPTGIIPLGTRIAATDAAITVVPDIISTWGRRDEPRPRQSGLVRIGTEYVFYRGVSSTQYQLRRGHEPKYTDKRDDQSRVKALLLTNCLRGVLGTAPRAHEAGETVEFLDEYPCSLTTTAVTDKSDSVGLLDAGLFPKVGYALLGSEVFGWMKKSSDTLEETARIRGCYGTQAAPHPEGAVCIALPFRYHSRYVPLYDGPELAWFAGARTVRGAVWENLDYKVERSDGKSGAGEEIRVRVVLNPDRALPWSEKPTNKADGLMEFTRDGAHTLPRVRADEMAFRVYFEYLPGAFTSNGWKRTLRLENVFLGYSTPLVVRRNDVVE